jgi:hypothetical protein
MCGGFTCTKNALTALNILYIVRIIAIIWYFELINWKLFFVLIVGIVRLDWSGGVWKSCQSSD